MRRRQRVGTNLGIAWMNRDPTAASTLAGATLRSPDHVSRKKPGEDISAARPFLTNSCCSISHMDAQDIGATGIVESGIANARQHMISFRTDA